MMGVLRIRDLDSLFFTIQYRTDLFTQILSLDTFQTAVMSAFLIIQSSMVGLAKLILEGKINKVEFINQLIVLGKAVFGVDKSILLQDRFLKQFLAMATLILVPAILFRDFGSPDQKRGTMLTYKFLSFGFLVLGTIFKTIGWMI